MSLSALNLGFSYLPMGLLNKEAGQESSHGVNHENNKKLGHSYNTHPSGSETDVCVCFEAETLCVCTTKTFYARKDKTWCLLCRH